MCCEANKHIYTTSGWGSTKNVTNYPGHTQKNGAVSIESYMEIAPFFCVCPV
jgi:hypothetical protein